ncbi:LysR substrate-binding domain-containing protein [Peribacillus frigoritolerans]|uniref:LysR substrate-binding domain-containing protein n=1 Tax=Peribacillus frigoritolerans TaxID=450367 RepID=UPI0021D2D00A|nr:LysR substrate-binding domain-containing protein [Peribacillus frigoritolerans]MCU6604118.1 LysR substrate-binding domain-containing protein [Peribacillus frigoritolerans]
MELRHIRYFVALAEELNFSRASERLHIAQPPLSRQIQQLEGEVGVLLFHRTNRRVELTNAGKAFLEKAYQMLDLVEDAFDTARMTARAEHGKLVIAFTGTGENILPIVQKYRAKYPSVNLNLQQMGTTAQIHALHGKQIDVGLLTPPVNSEQLIVKNYMHLPLKAMLPEKHPLALKGGPISIADLADESFVITPRVIGPGFYDVITKTCLQAGFSPNITVETHDLQTVMSLVSLGMGVSLTAGNIQTTGVVFKELADTTVMLDIAVAYRRDEKSEVFHSFLDMFFDYYSI